MYRVAHKDDFFKGMYQSNYATDYLQVWSKRGHCHPMPYNDPYLQHYYEEVGASKDHLYAFATEEQMRKWVTCSNQSALEDEGYVVWKIEPLDDAEKGVDYQVGESQMIFDSRKFKWSQHDA